MCGSNMISETAACRIDGFDSFAAILSRSNKDPCQDA